MAEYAVLANGLRRKFGATEAVSGIDIAVRPGEIYGFLGPNGAGKSTTVRMLTTLMLPTGGGAQVLGYDIVKQAAEVRTRIGVALQDATIDPKQTGRELLTLQGRLYGLSSRQIKDRIKDLERMVDIGPAFDRLIGTYSGGMKRRLDLAAAIIHTPTVLFLDEPTAGLDPVSRWAVWEQVRTFNREMGVTVFLTTQYLEEADALTDRIGIIVGGKIVAEDTPHNLKQKVGVDIIVVKTKDPHPEIKEKIEAMVDVERVDVYSNEVTISIHNGATHISTLAVALDRLKVDVAELSLRTPTLDDVFLQVAGVRLDEALP